MERGLGLPLDRLGPSIAMLPSADAATVAFAEVTSFVRFYIATASSGALQRLFAELKEGKDPNAALIAASGADLKAWDARWRAMIEAAAKAASPSPDEEVEHLGIHALRDLRDRSRLATLLLARGKPGPAKKELDRIPAATARAVASDPTLRWLRGRALEMEQREADADSLVDDPARVASSFGPWWALRGRRARARGEDDSSRQAFSEALAADPMEAEAACGSPDPAAAPDDPAIEPLCRAARDRGEPAFDDD